MISRKVTILNRNGIHVRPSKIIATAVADYQGQISVRKDDYIINSINVMNLLSMALLENDQISLTVSGEDEELVMEKLASLFEHHYDFPPQ